MIGPEAEVAVAMDWTGVELVEGMMQEEEEEDGIVAVVVGVEGTENVEKGG